VTVKLCCKIIPKFRAAESQRAHTLTSQITFLLQNIPHKRRMQSEVMHLKLTMLYSKKKGSIYTDLLLVFRKHVLSAIYSLYLQ